METVVKHKAKTNLVLENVEGTATLTTN